MGENHPTLVDLWLKEALIFQGAKAFDLLKHCIRQGHMAETVKKENKEIDHQKCCNPEHLNKANTQL